MFSTKKKEAFRLLGLNENATEQEIKKAYRKNALKYHPDKNNNDETASDMFKKVKEAYDTLLKKEPNIFSYEEQINIDVDDIFNMFNNMASENVFFFGPVCKHVSDSHDFTCFLIVFRDASYSLNDAAEYH